ncbi:Eco57I restriction-modification methylase domain-containing protein [Deinococcus sp. UYEF24]
MPQTEIVQKRHASSAIEKLTGATYTPPKLADFVAEQIIKGLKIKDNQVVHVLDPAIGEGELILSLLGKLKIPAANIIVHGFDTDSAALKRARQRIHIAFPEIQLHLNFHDFIDFVLSEYFGEDTLFSEKDKKQDKFDIIISNPPYVRTEIIGAAKSKELASSFKLSGKVDLYHAFLAGITQVLKEDGRAGIIVSNRFMTTKGGGAIRKMLYEQLSVNHIWDLGDTKLFDAAVLPAVLIANGKNSITTLDIMFSKIYATEDKAEFESNDPINALSMSGVISLPDERKFRVQHGILDKTGKDGIWRIATEHSDFWLSTVEANTCLTFRDIGKIRVGVKTCADKVFIRSDWSNLSEEPELLRPLTTHHIARRFRASIPKNPRAIVYPHEVVQNKRRVVDLELYPKTQRYLNSHRNVLESRTYVIESGRKWYEIWVPQDPAAWKESKLVFRDISEKPTFWLDLEGTVVNGDCYWIIPESSDNESLLWLAAAVANSTFSEAFYDHRFNNKLYAGRRRYITQYVEQFPLPDPSSDIGQDIIRLAKDIYESIDSPEARVMEIKLDQMVWESFGLKLEKVIR